MDCVHLTKNATGNSTFQIKTFYIPDQDKLHFPAFFSKSTQREHIHHLIFSKGLSGSNSYNTLPTAPLIRTLGSDKRRCFYFGDRTWVSFVHFKLLWCFKLLLFPKLRVWCLAMVTVLDIPNESDWWVRDRLLPAFPWCGGLWFLVTVPNYSQVKVTDETVLRCIVVLCSQDDWWVRD